jgi:hypothetical protein
MEGYVVASASCGRDRTLKLLASGGEIDFGDRGIVQAVTVG